MGPMVIISASGMADAGRVKHHISNNIENARNTILLTGYCEPHSLGGRLMAGAKEVNIFGVEHQVNAEVGAIRSMSAHGDYQRSEPMAGLPGTAHRSERSSSCMANTRCSRTSNNG